MLEVLLESRGVRQKRPLIATCISTLVHLTIVVALVWGGRHLAGQLGDDLVQQLSFIVPVDRGSPSPQQHLTYVAMGGGVSDRGMLEADKRRVDEKGAFALPQIAGAPTEPDVPVLAPTTPQSADNAYSVIEVDSAAVRDSSSAAPAYPHVMMTKGIEGYAAMRFVVDSTGLIDMGTVELLQATHAEFVQAVREAMPRMKFRPAKVGVATVRQLAEQLFKFEIRHTSSATEPLAKKP